ncbi:MAG: hypothetical protein KJO42_06890 [Silicimonas sp.]|nr:hypothetical protein [Silicimonas sp.]
MITRRDTARLLLATAASAALPPLAHAATGEEWRGAVEQALRAAEVPSVGTRLNLVDFGFGSKSGWVGFSAVIRMDWPPGVRKRRFDLTAEGEQATFKAFVTMFVGEFRRVNPAGVREVAFR